MSNISSTSSAVGGNVSLDYDAATGGYTIRTAAGDMAFLPTDKSALDSDATLSVYRIVDGAREDQLVLFNPGASNPQLALTYASYGAWQTLVDTGSSIDFSQQYFVYGVRQAADAPSTGSASYTTRPDGFWSTSGGLYALGGTSSFTADFSAMTVATSLNLVGTNILTDATRTLGAFNGTGSIAQLGGTFSGTLVHQGADQGGVVYSGGFAGAFFGPQGQEVGYTFRLTSPEGAAVGAVVGKAD